MNYYYYQKQYSFLLLLLVLRYMKFSRSNLRQVVDSRSVVHESKNKTTVYVKWLQIVHSTTWYVHLLITQYLIYVS